MQQIPPQNDPLWTKLVTGLITHKFELFAANMSLAHAMRIVAKDPARKSVAIEELRKFCSKYVEQMANELNALR